MWKSKTSLIAITMGDPAGIGPEVIAKALSKPSVQALGHFLIIGDYSVFKKYSISYFKNVSFLDLKTISRKDFFIGKPNKRTAKASLCYVDKAMQLIERGE